MDNFFGDIHYGLRQFRKAWGVTVVIVLSIAIGVSASTTVFGWLDTIVFDPLPIAPRGHELVTVVTRTQSGDYLSSSYADYEDWRDQSRSLRGVAVFQERPLSLDSRGQSRRIWAMGVSGNFFDVLQLRADRGHFFLPEDAVDAPGGAPVAVISHDFWKRQFNSDPSVIGRSIQLNRQELTIIGVTQKGFKGTIVGLSFDVWLPLRQMDKLVGGKGEWVFDRKFRGLHAIARLQPSTALAAAQAELDMISARLAQQHPDENAGSGAHLFPLAKTPYGAQALLSQLLNVLLFASLIVLLIVSANITNILMVRAADREKEIGIRMALGASRVRVFRQLLTEGLVVALLAALVSIALAWLMSGLLRYFVPVTDLPVSLASGLNLKVLAFAAALSLLAGLASALVPALHSMKIKVGDTLKDSSRGVSSGRGKQRLRASLAVAEIALAFVALTGAVLFVRIFDAVNRIEPGFDTQRVLLIALSPNEPGHSIEDLGAYYTRAAERLKALPGVRAVGYAEHVPLGLKGGSWEDLAIEGYEPRLEESMRIYRNFVDEAYFDVMGIARIDGRSFQFDDDAASDPVAIVNETFAKRYFEGGSALGRRIQGWGKELTVVGVVTDSKYASRTESAQPYLYVPYRQFADADSDVILHVNVVGVPQSLQAAARNEVSELNSIGHVAWAMPLENYIGASGFKHKMAAVLLSVLGLTALLLAVLGIYGVVSHSVTQRTNEIGIRMALGATRREVLLLIVWQGLRITLLGLGVGVCAALLLSGMLTSLLFGVNAVDPFTYAGVVAVLLCVAVLGSCIPATRAVRVNPIQALRMS